MDDERKRWDTRYSDPEFAYGEEPNEYLVAHAGRIAKGRVLCLADGEGRNSVWLARQGYEVTAIDFSTAGAEKAQRLAARHGVSLDTIVADLDGYDLGTSCWQGIAAIFAHVPPHVLQSMHRACVRALAPGGVFILEAYGRDQLKYGTGGPKKADWLLSLDETREELAGLEFIEARECVRSIHEGLYHTGDAAVVQICAVKPKSS